MDLGELLLLSGNDIPFPGARVNVHQPTLKEIAYIGEDVFFIGCGFLNFSKNILDDKDKVQLSNYNDFDIFMSIILKNEKTVRHTVECALSVLTLIFPLYQVDVHTRNDAITLKLNEEEFYINKINFEEFKKIISSMFYLNINESETEKYNPAGDMSKRIAEKFKKRHEQLLKIEQEKQKNKSDKKVSILSRYVSILAVGLQKDFNDLMQYTVYQIINEFQRFQLKMQWDAYIQARMAGASDLEEVDNWMIDLQDQGKNKIKNKK